MGRLQMLKPQVRMIESTARTLTPKSWTSSDRGGTTERGYGGAWQKLRKQILMRDCGLCQPCKQAGRVTLATEVDHIVNKAQGGKDNPLNLQSICKPCHTAKTAEESAKAQGAGWR